MQKEGNLLYKWEVIQNLAEFLSLKDLLGTATLSKEYNHTLKKYIKEHFALSNQQNQSEFQQLKSLFNRKIYTYHKLQKFAKPNPSNFIVRSIQSQEIYSVVETLDCQFKLIKTDNLIMEQMAELISFPQQYRFVGITEGGMIYCAQNDRLTRYNGNNDPLFNGETVKLKGEIQGLYCAFKFTLVVVRDSPESVSLLLFDSNEKLQVFTLISLISPPFQISSFKIEDHLAMGNHFNYFILNETLYDFNVKTGLVHQHPQFVGKKIVRIIGGKGHFIAYEKTQDLTEHWSTEDVIKFAQKEGLDDFIKIFKVEKVTGKTLLEMDKKYMQEVLGIENVKIQQKLKLRSEDCNKEDPDSYVLHAWGRGAEGQLGTNPSKEITKPFKFKLPQDCQVLKLAGNFTFLYNKKSHVTLVNSIDEKTNKLEWKQMTNRKIWSLSVVDESVILVASASKEKIPQRETEQIVVEKKEKLRTAKNIADKINWDEHLKPEQFKVGYLDKYEGILQIPFEELERTEIKQYRIEYFKRGAQVVWDKKKRIDIL